MTVFQSTPPVKAATIRIWFYAFPVIISIHAAREGGDVILPLSVSCVAVFQSTPPVKAATCIV